MTIETEKVQKIGSLLDEFVANYPATSAGKEHVQLYVRGREQGRANYQAVLTAVRNGEDATTLILEKLLPHANTKGNRAKGAWIHHAPSVIKDVKKWFEAAKRTKGEDWSKIAQAILSFVTRCTDAPGELSDACAWFVGLAYTKGFQTGMLTPILNALRPDDFLLINSKSLVIINALAVTNLSTGLLDYPEANATGKRLIEALDTEMSKRNNLAMRTNDFFDMFCHWVVAVKKTSFGGKSSRKSIDRDTTGQDETTWGGSLHQSFRLLPIDRCSPNLRPFLEGEGQTPEQVLARLPYDTERSSNPTAGGPDPKRYRDGKQIYQTGGLLYERTGTIYLTDLGHTVLRWLDILTPKNRKILARHAAYALAACQLRNPTGSGRKYAMTVCVFPFAFIWRAMLALDGRISSNELNRCLFKVKNESELNTAIRAIREARTSARIELLGEETLTGKGKNDRIIPWVSLASFGWTLFPDKRSAHSSEDVGYYELDTQMIPIIKEAAQIRHRHREFATTEAYVEHISRCAALPKDLR